MPQFSVDLSSNRIVKSLSEKDCAYLHDKISHTRFLANDARMISLAESKLYDAGKTLVNIVRILMDAIDFSAVIITIDNATHRVDGKFTIKEIKMPYIMDSNGDGLHSFAIHVEYTQREVDDRYFGKYIITVLDRGVLISRLAYEQDDHDMVTYDMNFPSPSIFLSDILRSIMSILEP